MGASYSYLTGKSGANNVEAEEHQNTVKTAVDTPRKKRKREIDEVSSDEDSIGQQTSSMRKKLKTTSEYIYKALFVKGEGSDVTIIALDTEWHLHKLYLCQSPYFCSMFKGQWVEKGKCEIPISLPDDLITVTALDIAFGSLYSYEVDSEALMNNMIPVLAASRMFQLDGLLQHCEDSMLETIGAGNVCQFYEAASRYGLKLVKESCFSWLEQNMLVCRTPSLVKYLTQSLLRDVVSSNNLVVMQVEMDIYSFLKVWLYLQLHQDCKNTLKELVTKTQKYFQQEKKKNATTFLETELGSPYADVFESLRLQNMISDVNCSKLLQIDSIIPRGWILPLYEKQWRSMLSVYCGYDKGPVNVDEGLFDKHSCRSGRVLDSNTRYCWRWTGFSYGIDMIVTYNNRTKTLLAKRNTFSQPCNFAVCLQSQRSVAMRFKAFTKTANGKENLSKDTGLIHWLFRTDEEIPLLVLDEEWKFPIYISARILLSSLDCDQCCSGCHSCG